MVKLGLFISLLEFMPQIALKKKQFLNYSLRIGH